MRAQTVDGHWRTLELICTNLLGVEGVDDVGRLAGYYLGAGGMGDHRQ